MNCPLCLNSSSTLFDQDKLRTYYLCDQCRLVFVPRNSLISALEEKKRYDSHQNAEEDSGYQNYLSKISQEIIQQLPVTGRGLDFGCGATKILGNFIEKSGFKMDSYDLYYWPEESIWENRYDFIILSEVIEHLNSPREVMTKLAGLLNPQGRIFIKTKTYPPQKEFQNWFYKRDITHVQFFNQNSFEVLAEFLRLTGPERIGEDLYLFKK